MPIARPMFGRIWSRRGAARVAKGIVGYGLRKLAIDPAPLIIAGVPGPLMEKAFRQTRLTALGDGRLLVLRALSLARRLARVLLLVGLPLLAGPGGHRGATFTLLTASRS